MSDSTSEQRSPALKNCDMTRLKRLTDFLFEVGMLRHTPRTGYQFLGSGKESVAEHSFRTSIIGFVLAEMAGADSSHTAMMCLFHDVHEARTGDLNYVNKMYCTANGTQALKDATAGTGLSEKVLGLWGELEGAESEESRLAQDADQIDFIMCLKEQMDLGNPYAEKWLQGALKRLRTPQGKELAAQVHATDQSDWWFLGPDSSWWANKNGKDKK